MDMDMDQGTIGARLGAVRFLLGRLDRRVALRLFDHYADLPEPDGPLVSHLGGLLLDVLNGPRRAHAQRLWTGWVEPVMLRDDTTLAAERLPPGCIHAVDAGAWWQVLAPRMPEEAALVQELVAGRARFAPLDRVLASADTGRWAERLRRRTLDELAAVRDDAAACREMLEAVNHARHRLIAGRPSGRATLGRDDLDRLAAILRDAPRWRTDGPV